HVARHFLYVTQHRRVAGHGVQALLQSCRSPGARRLDCQQPPSGKFGTVDGGPVLHLILRVRLAVLAAVADRPDPLPDASGIPDTYADAPRLEVRHHHIPSSADVDHHEVGGRKVGASDRLVWMVRSDRFGGIYGWGRDQLAVDRIRHR
ncbi:MAG TPA: hypothetical protein VIQ76_18325, partial [Propionibacteriaceae bacterium]